MIDTVSHLARGSLHLVGGEYRTATASRVEWDANLFSMYAITGTWVSVITP